MASNDPAREGRWFLTALLLLFIAFKVAGVIDWSWIWVLAPFWVPLMIGLLYIAVRLAWIAREAICGGDE